MLTPIRDVIVVRATILSVVLALAAGPGVSLCCGEWFDATTAAASDCRHDPGGSGPEAGRHLGCQPVRLGAVAMLKEAERRMASADGLVAIPVASFQFVAATSRRRAAYGVPRAACESRRPLTAPLRILTSPRPQTVSSDRTGAALSGHHPQPCRPGVTRSA